MVKIENIMIESRVKNNRQMKLCIIKTIFKRLTHKQKFLIYMFFFIKEKQIHCNCIAEKLHFERYLYSRDALQIEIKQFYYKSIVKIVCTSKEINRYTS